MADATLPTVGTHHPGHVPFWLRARHAMKSPGHAVRLVDVDGALATIEDQGTVETLWTHPPAARALAEAFTTGIRDLSRYGTDIFIMKGFAMSLVDPARASLCREPDECGHGRLISVHTGKPWDIEDTLRDQSEAQAADAEGRSGPSGA